MAKRDAENDEEFDRVIHEYYQAVEADDSVDPEVFIRRHADHESQLRSFFADLHALDELPGLGVMERTIDQRESQTSQVVLPTITQGDQVTYVGQYRLLEEIARGGMGVVFKARQEKLSRVVALKMILSGQLASSTEIDRFRREARAAARLQHPNIVSVHEIGQHDGYYFFTMDFIESESLGERIREGSLSAEESARLVDTLARAMHYAHGQGVLHRDLKPANVLIDGSGQPHITDFGLAKAQADVDHETLQEMTRTGQILGTPSYMSPEQASGHADLVDVRSDVYSLGAILYACLVGRAPFVGESSIETLQKVLHEEPPKVRLLNSRVPKDLETICHKALSKEPRHRYPTAEELADDLTCFLEGRPVSARPIPVTTRLYRWSHRRPAAAALSGLLLFLAVFIPINAVFYARHERHRAAHEQFLREQADRETHKAQTANERLVKALGREEAARKQAEQSRNAEKTAREKESAARKEAEIATAREQVARKAIERSAEEARWKTYVARMTIARQPWIQGEFGQLEEQLQQVVPEEGRADFRGWEWDYYRNQIHQLSKPIDVSGTVKAACWSRDGKFIITGGSKLEVWDARTFASIFSKDLGTKIFSLSMSPEDKQLAVGVLSGEIALFDFQTLNIEKRWKAHLGATDYLSYSPDGTRIASGTLWGASRIWDVESGKKLRELTRRIPDVYMRNVTWNPKKELIAISDRRGYVRVFDATTGASVFKHRACGISCNTASWRPDGEVLIGGAMFPNYTLFTYSTDGEIIDEFDLSADFVCWSPDGKRLVVGGTDQDLRIVDMSSGEVSHRLRSHASPVKGVQWSPLGERILSLDYDGKVRVSTVNLRNLPADTVYRSNEHRVYSLRLSPDGKHFVAACGDKRLRIWGSDDLRLMHTSPEYPTRIGHVTWSANGQELISVCADNRVRSWKIDSSEITSPFDPKFRGGGVHLWIDWRPGTNQVSLGETADDTCLFDFSTKQLIRQNATNYGFGRWNSDGTRLAVGKAILDGDLNRVRTVHEPAISFYAWSPNGRLVAHGLSNGDLAIYDSYKDIVLKRIKAHQNVIKSVAWNPSGTRIASGDSEGELKLWDSATLDKVWQVETSQEVNSLAWTQDGKDLISAGGLPQTHATNEETDLFALCVWKSSDINANQEHHSFLSTTISRATHDAPSTLASIRWILNTGGRVELRGEDGMMWIDSIDRVPSSSFELVSIDLSGCEIDESALIRCGEVGTVTRVNLRNTDISDKTLLQLAQLLAGQSVHVDFSHRHFEILPDHSVKPVYTPEEELALLTKEITRNPSDPEVYRGRSKWFSKHLHWKEALADIETYLEYRKYSRWVRCEAALAARLSNDISKFHDYLPDLETILDEKKKGPDNAIRFMLVAKLLNPDLVESPQVYLSIAEDLKVAGNFFRSRPYLMSLLRCDHHDRLLKELDDTIYLDHTKAQSQNVQHAAMRAICLHQLGRTKEADDELALANKIAAQCWPRTDQPFGANYGDFTAYAPARLLLTEAQKLIDGTDSTEP